MYPYHTQLHVTCVFKRIFEGLSVVGRMLSPVGLTAIGRLQHAGALKRLMHHRLELRKGYLCQLR